MRLIQLRSFGAILSAFRGDRHDDWPPMPDGAYVVADSDGYVRIVGGTGADFQFYADNVTTGQMAAFASADPAVWDAIRDFYERRSLPIKRWEEVRLERAKPETRG